MASQSISDLRKAFYGSTAQELADLAAAIATGKTFSTLVAGSWGGGAGGVNEIWLPGSDFAGNASGFGTPGGGGTVASFQFAAGQDRYGVAELAIPSGWTTFSTTYYVASDDTNAAHHYIFESTYQLLGAGTALNPGGVSHGQSFLNAGVAGALTIGVATPDITRGSNKILNYKVRSNNATQEVTGEIRLLGLLFAKVT